jgi:predicted PurR-regulated permease PerM
MPPERAGQSDTRPVAWVALACSLGALFVLMPLGAPILLSAWFAMFMRPVLVRATRLLHGRERAAAAVTVGLLLSALVPVVLVIASAVSNVVELARWFLKSESGRAALEQIVRGARGASEERRFLPDHFDTERIIELIRLHGERAYAAVQAIVGAGAIVLLDLFLFTVGVFSFLVRGHETYLWFEDRSPLSREHTARLAAAFTETGRGLFIGMGLTALLQGTVAGITYATLGIPSAFVLGTLTTITALIPSFGTLLVWGPVAAGLALTGQPAKATILVVVGVAIIGSIDNFLRPIISRWGRLTIPTFPLMLSLFGGVAAFGADGIFLGPLIVRLAMEALTILGSPTSE